jgi:glutathionylspermidine synthase
VIDECQVHALGIADPLALPELAAALSHTYLVWDAWTGGQRRVDLHPLVLGADVHERAVGAARAAWSLAHAASERAHSDEAEATRYRFHPDVTRLCQASRRAGDVASLVRVDLLLRDDGRFVACEINADCPGGHNEALGLPRLAALAGARGGKSPNSVVERLVERLFDLSGGRGSPRGAVALVFATAWAEDLQVCALLERLLTERGARAVRVPPTALVADADGGLTYRGERVAVLYRFYPTEYMEEQDGVEVIARAVEAGRVATLSSFSHMYAQSKLSMARVLAAEPVRGGAVFPETHAFTDVPAAVLERERERWVVKRALSRVGEHVLIGASTDDHTWRRALAEIAERERADDEVWIAQRLVDQRPVDTPWGPRWLTLGAYLLDGEFVGYFARLSPELLASHDAIVLPVLVAPARREVSPAEART